MGALIALIPSLLSLLGNFIPSLKDYANYKQQELQAQQTYQLALLQAQITQAQAEVAADSADLRDRLASTSSSFKQTTFWLIWIPVLFTMMCPQKAAVMWQNFSTIPPMFQWLYMGMYASIWGFPIARGGYGALTDLLSMRWDKQISKAAVDRKAIFETLKVAGIFNGTQQQVNDINKAIDAGTKG